METAPESTVRREERPRSSAEGALEPHLFVVMECGRPFAGGARYGLLEIDEVQLGRGPARSAERRGRTLVVTIPDSMMSSTHARLVRAGGWVLQDAGSTNGSLVDGDRVSSAHLEEDMLVELGATLFAIRWLPTPKGTALDEEVDADGEGTPGMSTLIPEYAQALCSLRQVMASTVPILLLGETGTGKELLARATHQVAERRGTFVAVNCGAIPASLVESQLFGHVRGAFSGAARDEPGFVRTSDRGTLFLDEIGDLPAASQAALLRVLQESEVVSLGTTRPVKVDLRVVSATLRPVDALAEGTLRADLYARLAGYVHRLPTLSERREDLGIIVAALLRDLAPERTGKLVLDPAVGRTLCCYAWPHNVRELRHVLATALVFATDGRIDLAHLPLDLRASPPSSAERGRSETSPQPLGAADQKLHGVLIEHLTAHKGNVSEVARALGRTRMQIHRWMRRFGVDPARFRR
jgi:DNA-binding NtrC family response regulator